MLHVLFQGGGKLDERDEIPWVYVHWSFLYWVDTFSLLAHVLWRFVRARVEYTGRFHT